MDFSPYELDPDSTYFLTSIVKFKSCMVMGKCHILAVFPTMNHFNMHFYLKFVSRSPLYGHCLSFDDT